MDKNIKKINIPILTEEEFEMVDKKLREAEQAIFREIQLGWFPLTFGSNIDKAIVNVMEKVVYDLHKAVKEEKMYTKNAIVVNPCIENSTNYQYMVAKFGEDQTKDYVNATIEKLKEDFGEYYDIINQNSFKGLMREL